MIQFCDQNADDFSSFLDDGDATRGAELMDPIRLLQEPSAARPSSENQSAKSEAPPARVWSSIEATLRREGLLAE